MYVLYIIYPSRTLPIIDASLIAGLLTLPPTVKHLMTALI